MPSRPVTAGVNNSMQFNTILLIQYDFGNKLWNSLLCSFLSTVIFFYNGIVQDLQVQDFIDKIWMNFEPNVETFTTKIYVVFEQMTGMIIIMIYTYSCFCPLGFKSGRYLQGLLIVFIFWLIQLAGWFKGSKCWMLNKKVLLHFI